MYSEDLQFVIDCLPTEELLCQLAEEASELAQAALKLRRAYDGTNPTPVPKEDAIKALQEEVADVLNCLRALGMDSTAHQKIYWEIGARKTARWAQRLEESENEK